MDPRQAYLETIDMLFLLALRPNRNRLMSFKYPLWYIYIPVMSEFRGQVNKGL